MTTTAPVAPTTPPALRAVGMVGGVVGLVVLAAISLSIGVADLSWEIVSSSRLPRTLALVLSGAALAVCGLLLQLLVRNRFVEPSTVGTTEAAGLGLVVVTLLAPGAPLLAKMGTAALFALVGTWLFLAVVRMMPVQETILVPLVGLMLGGVIAAATTFLAFHNDLLQTLNSWMTGDFSGILRGRYELLWVAAVLVAIAFFAADRFTVAGMGETFSTNVGLDHRKVMAVGLGIISVVSAVVVVTVGMIPFLGLVVPNVVSALVGDNARRGLPWVAILGSGLVLVCDIVGRLVRHPYEIPVGTVMGVLGAAFFLYLLLRRSPDAS
ncbi:ABC transporter permease [Nocardioides jishulii]|uniref:ABC transporter permease n=1 Tax=Nocardioides jishulii TaxID=2575440 RepID=A0A4U2YH20_9ACTN|nr:iron chelate uptake ABC transporter family permease subunit [Nocardioides jishulii]QCX26761.1 iron chelate uptake ABC transporter family permease subunit [Nocardioides jishulii]TKI60269.1 ABC transporter permease [Nocardioides jishulii]